MIRAALLAAALLWPAASFAQDVPPEVMAYYSVYAAELAKAEPDQQRIGASALLAWETAEEMLGDHKTTGDLAMNFAGNAPRTLGKRLTEKDREKAYKRAIELASTPEIRAERTILWLQDLIDGYAAYSASKRRKAKRLAEDLLEELGAAGMDDRVYRAEALTALAQLHLISDNTRKARETATAAKKAFASRTDDLFSVHEYQLPLFLAVAARRDGDDIAAARSLQGLVEDHFELAGTYTGPSAVAYGQWLDMRDGLEGRADEPDVAELLTWTPPPELQKLTSPILRVPPIMPPSARTSGWVNVRYDVSDEGRPVNIEVIESSDRVFERPSLKSVAEWGYAPGVDSPERRDLETTITFQLTSPSGRLIPPPRPAPPLPGE